MGREDCVDPADEVTESMPLFKAIVLMVVILVLNACGSDSNNDTSATPTPTTIATHRVSTVIRQRRTPRPTAIPVATAPPASSDEESSQTFDDPSTAQSQCPNDTVVWVNSNSGIYHMPGERWYGNTENGFYMCQQAADAAGYRETENGQ